ncbi:MAG TPA: hypothetical protein PK992_01425 [Planctomycetaceae bacterium]|nr:hypothetical protein [Planctomycetaceae bacterium]
MNRIAFLSMDSLEDFVSYDALVADRLKLKGFTVDDVSWRNQSARWSDYDMVIIRSPWDYQQAADEFLAVLETIEASTARLWNSIDVVRWNIRKTYLRELSERNLQIVPTVFVLGPTESQLLSLFDALQSEQLVIKPVVGANADGTYRLSRSATSGEIQRIATLYRGHTALVQPFVQSVIERGELSLVFFDGQYSHCILKTPKTGDFRVQEEHGGLIRSHQPDAAVIEFAQRCLAAVPHRLLYARVDLVELENGQPAVMELELIEPSLYLSFDADAPERFADAIQRFNA